MNKPALFLLLLPAMVWTSCGGGSSDGGPPPPAITISISPATATLETGDPLQFTATVRNTTNTAVSWQVNNIAGGNATVGSISAAGIYTAPTSVPNPADVTVRAVSQADATKSASATVTITPDVGVGVTPSSVTLPAGSSQQFTATLDGSETTAVDWLVSGVVGGNSTVGTISPEGLYTTPLSPPPTGIATITAVSQANPDDSDSAAATIVFSDATLTGRYAFTSFSVSQYGVPIVGGSFVADGGGGIIDGIGEDLTGAVVPFSGSYSIGPDGRGSATITALEGSSTFRLVMSSTNEGRLIPFDVTAFPMEILFAPETIGTIEKQDPSAFLNSALNGGYAFMFSGFGENGALAASGRFTADGAGGISEGAEDHNDGGVVSVNIPFTGTYSVGASGRGTASFTSSLGTSNFAFYVISARKLRFISIDILTPFVFGTAERQESASFSNTSFSGNYVLFSNASGPSSTTFTLGRFTAGGDGSISSGLLDINNGGSAFENLPFTANYTIVANGRGTLTLTNELETSNFALAMISPQSAFFIQTDTTQTSGGRIDAQQGTSFTNGSLAGGWALELAGISIEVTTKIIAKLVGMVAQANANGAGNLTGKNDLYLNDPNGQGTLTLDGAFGGAYTVSSNGRVAASVNTGAGQIELRGYVAGSKIPLIGVDIFHFVMGAAHRQF